MPKLDLTLLTRAADRLLETTENPRYRQILENYRRHALLEVSGRWEEILDPVTTVEHPVYLINDGGKSVVLDRREQVRFYRTMSETGALVIVTEDEQIAVADWGFASESVVNHQLPGRVLAKTGVEVDDVDSWYVLRRRMAMIWPYDFQGRMMGEHVYEHAASREVIRLAAEDVITSEEAQETLAPLIRPLPLSVPAGAPVEPPRPTLPPPLRRSRRSQADRRRGGRHRQPSSSRCSAIVATEPVPVRRGRSAARAAEIKEAHEHRRERSCRCVTQERRSRRRDRRVGVDAAVVCVTGAGA